jgi:hypothetical protein
MALEVVDEIPALFRLWVDRSDEKNKTKRSHDFFSTGLLQKLKL